MFCPSNSTNATDDSNLQIASAISCLLSMLGAVVIMMTYCCIETIRNTTRKLVTLLTVADFFTSAGYLSAIVVHKFPSTKFYHQSTFCEVQSAVTTYSSMVSFFFTVAIAACLFFMIFRKAVPGKRFYLTTNFVSWTIPGIVIAVALNQSMLGRDDNDTTTIGTGPWCWVKCNGANKMRSLFYMLFTGKFWEISCYIITATFYVLLKLKLYLHHRFHTLDQLNPDLRSDDRNFLYVWLVLLAVRIWGTIRFLLTATFAYDVLNPPARTVILYLQAIGDPSQAFFNCILFCLFDNEVRGRIVSRIKCCISSKVQDAPQNHVTCSTSSLPSVAPSEHESHWEDSSPEMSESAKLVDKEKPGHEKLYQSVNNLWSESNSGVT